MAEYNIEYKFIFENRLLNICELNKRDLDLILNKSYDIKFIYLWERSKTLSGFIFPDSL